MTAEAMTAYHGFDAEEIAITSGVNLVEGTPPGDAFTLAEVPGIGVVVEPAEGDKCERCWRVLPDVGANSAYPGVCGRCVDVVRTMPPAAE